MGIHKENLKGDQTCYFLIPTILTWFLPRKREESWLITAMIYLLLKFLRNSFQAGNCLIMVPKLRKIMKKSRIAAREYSKNRWFPLKNRKWREYRIFCSLVTVQLKRMHRIQYREKWKQHSSFCANLDRVFVTLNSVQSLKKIRSPIAISLLLLKR